MFFPTSGRMGFDTSKHRLNSPNRGRRVLDLIQQHVVEHFGYHDVNTLRTALHRFPDDPAVKLAYY
ncbi:unnamed protein product, partial [Rotaria magnacalcarata]